ncbi:hypothetical protein CDAR_385691 [Caerostris darwini]|uniref:Uncharacterized protein n=1 Tax=Caerostris darwini TaxID=1538125 RepID=A0AAV4M4Y3_9ARAC|nr:hypothetical protein CDAR_385691 [Caerostris darwini]
MLLLFSRVGPQSECVFGDFFQDQVSKAIVVGVRMKNRDSGRLNREWRKFERKYIWTDSFIEFFLTMKWNFVVVVVVEHWCERKIGIIVSSMPGWPSDESLASRRTFSGNCVSYVFRIYSRIKCPMLL